MKFFSSLATLAFLWTGALALLASPGSQGLLQARNLQKDGLSSLSRRSYDNNGPSYLARRAPEATAADAAAAHRSAAAVHNLAAQEHDNAAVAHRNAGDAHFLGTLNVSKSNEHLVMEKFHKEQAASSRKAAASHMSLAEKAERGELGHGGHDTHVDHANRSKALAAQDVRSAHTSMAKAAISHNVALSEKAQMDKLKAQRG